MADVRDIDEEAVVNFWIKQLQVKRREVRRRTKENLRVVAILNNGIIRNRIRSRELMLEKRQGGKIGGWVGRFLRWLVGR
jgi:hypothetical protein